MIHLSFQGQQALSLALHNITDPHVIQRAVNAAAESWVDDTLNYIQQGRAFTPREGHLEQSIGWHGNGNGSATVYANAEYASYVEFGTRPHVIRPKAGRKALKIPQAGGGYILRAGVNHPGSRPYPFFYADRANREQNMVNRALHVIQGVI